MRDLSCAWFEQDRRWLTVCVCAVRHSEGAVPPRARVWGCEGGRGGGGGACGGEPAGEGRRGDRGGAGAGAAAQEGEAGQAEEGV